MTDAANRIRPSELPPRAPVSLPAHRRQWTYDVSVGSTELTVSVGYDAEGRIREFFVRVHKEGAATQAYLDVIARLGSTALRLGAEVETVARQLESTPCSPSGIYVGPDGQVEVEVGSLSEGVARVLLRAASEAPPPERPRPQLRLVYSSSPTSPV